MMRMVEKLIRANGYEAQQLQISTLKPQSQNHIVLFLPTSTLVFISFPTSEIALGTSTTGTDSDAVFETSPESKERCFGTECISCSKHSLGV